MALERPCVTRQSIRVGGVLITVASRHHRLLPEVNPDYLPFLDTATDPSDAGIRVDLRVGKAPVASRGRVLLEAGDSWTLRERAGNLIITPHRDREGVAPSWEAEIDPGCRSVRVLCGSELLADHGGRPCLASPFHYPLDQVVMMLALAGEGLIVHAAGVDLHGRGVILAGPSRAGKTTIARLCAAAGMPILSDDRVIVRRVGDSFRIFGTPWPGEGRFAENRGVPLAALVFLTKGDVDRLSPLSPTDTTRRLLPVISVPWFDHERAGCSLDLCRDLIGSHPAHELAFRPDAGAVRALESLFASVSL